VAAYRRVKAKNRLHLAAYGAMKKGPNNVGPFFN